MLSEPNRSDGLLLPFCAAVVVGPLPNLGVLVLVGNDGEAEDDVGCSNCCDRARYNDKSPPKSSATHHCFNKSHMSTIN